MKRKRFSTLRICALLSVAAALFACQNPLSEDRPVNRVRLSLSGSVVVTVRGGGEGTDDERAVSRRDLYVFQSGGRLVQHLTLNGAEELFDFYLPNGTFDFYAFANAPEGIVAEPSTAAELMSSATLLTDNRTDAFVMSGAVTSREVLSNVTLEVPVRRNVAKVTFVLRRGFESPSLAALPLEIDGVYMTNVCGSNDYAIQSFPGASGLWHNALDRGQLSAPDARADALLYRGYDPAASVPNGDTLAVAGAFYPYPNDMEADTHGTDSFSPRRTRVVVKARLGGTVTYYPVTLAAVERNKHYHVDLTVTNYGVSHPELVPQSLSYTNVTITVMPWEDGGEIHATI